MADQFIEDFRRPSDPVEDWLPAMRRAQEDTPADQTGFTLRLRPTTYRFSGPIQLFRPMRLAGSGGAGYGGGTRLKFDLPAQQQPATGPNNQAVHAPTPGTGIVAHSAATAWHAGWPDRGAHGAVIETLTIIGPDSRDGAPGVPIDSGGDGIRAHARIAVRDCYISGFARDGIHISASLQPNVLDAGIERPWDYRRDLPYNLRLPDPEPGDASFWSVHNTLIGGCGRHALFVDGADANAGLGELVDGRDNGGYAVYDSSFLGNTFIACMAHANGHQVIRGTDRTDPAAAALPAEWEVGGVLQLAPSGATRVYNDWFLDLNPGDTLTDPTASLFEIVNGRIAPVAIPGALTFDYRDEPHRPPFFVTSTRNLTIGGLYVVHVTGVDSAGRRRQCAAPFYLTALTGGGYATDNPNQRTMFLNCYTEGAQPATILGYPSQIIGGVHGSPITGTGYQFLGDTMTQHSAVVRIPPSYGKRSTAVTIGSDDPNIAAYVTFRPADPTHNPSYLRYLNGLPNWDTIGEWVGFNHARLDQGWSLLTPLNSLTSQVRTSTTPKVARYSPALPNYGLYLGSTWVGVVPPATHPDGRPASTPPNSGTWDAGDIVFNPRATADGPWQGWIGAVCTEGGTAGVLNGPTAGTRAGETAIELAESNQNISVGDFITVASAADPATTVATRVTLIHNTKLGVRDHLPASIADITIAYTAPRWRRFGALDSQQ